jgi:hypothetical protein
MYVKLFTGLPGAGKTAQLVAEILRFQKEEPHRPRFYMGINGLAEGLADELTLEQLHEWWELPKGAVIFIDEAQEDHLMPKAGKTPDWVRRMSKVRHHGMTFCVTTQKPVYMSAYVLGLVDQHVHTVNKFGTSMIAKYTWGRCIEEPEKPFQQKSAVEGIGTLPKEVFDLYTSSSLHTRKRRIPRKVYMLVALVVVALCAVVATPFVLKRAADRSKASITGTAKSEPESQAQRASGDGKSVDDDLRKSDYPKWLAPRVEGQPWTAPAFDQLQVQAQPRIYCVANEDGGCHCRTEQGTRYAVKPDMCRVMVQEGGVYNPFQPPQERVQEVQEHGEVSRDSRAGVSSPASAAQRYRAGAGTSAYTPPELTTVSAIAAK